MKCLYCGAENPHGARFCLNCGQDLPLNDEDHMLKKDSDEAGDSAGILETRDDGVEELGSVFDEVPVPPAGATHGGTEENPFEKILMKVKKIPLKTAVIVVIAIAVVCGTAAGILYYNSFSDVELITDDLEVMLYGGNDYARAEIISYGADYSELENEYEEADYSTYDLEDLERDSKRMMQIADFQNSVEYTVEYPEGKENENLSNGDVIRITAEYDKDLAKKAHIRVKNTEYEYTVDGLQELTELALFDQIEVKWTASSNRASLELINHAENEYLQNVSYHIGNVENGMVTVTASVSEEKLIEDGYIAKDGEYEKTFTVGNKPICITSLSGDGVAEAFVKEAEKYAESFKTGCGKVYLEGNPLTVTGYTIGEPSEGWSSIRMNIEFTLSSGQTYTVSPDIYLFRMEDDSISSLREYSFENDSCEISKYYVDDPE